MWKNYWLSNCSAYFLKKLLAIDKSKIGYFWLETKNGGLSSNCSCAAEETLRDGD